MTYTEHTCQSLITVFPLPVFHENVSDSGEPRHFIKSRPIKLGMTVRSRGFKGLKDDGGRK